MSRIADKVCLVFGMISLSIVWHCNLVSNILCKILGLDLKLGQLIIGDE